MPVTPLIGAGRPILKQQRDPGKATLKYRHADEVAELLQFCFSDVIRRESQEPTATAPVVGATVPESNTSPADTFSTGFSLLQRE